MNDFWSDDYPESRFSSHEVLISDVESFSKLPVLDIVESNEFRHMKRLLIKLCLYIASQALTDIQFQIFTMRYISQQGQEEIANVLNVSQPYVSLVGNRCMVKIKRGVEKFTIEKVKGFRRSVAQVFGEYVLGLLRICDRDGEIQKGVRKPMRKKVNGVKKDFAKIFHNYADKNLDVSRVEESRESMKEMKKFRKKLARDVTYISNDFLKEMLMKVYDTVLEEKESVAIRDEKLEILQEFLSLMEGDLEYLSAQDLQ